MCAQLSQICKLICTELANAANFSFLISWMMQQTLVIPVIQFMCMKSLSLFDAKNFKNTKFVKECKYKVETVI